MAATPSLVRIQDQLDFSGTPGSGTNGYALTWDNATARFVLTAVAATPAGSSGQVQYNAAGAFGGADGLAWSTSSPNLTVTAQNAAHVPMLTQLVASQTADAFQVKNSSGSLVWSVKPNGAIYQNEGVDDTAGTVGFRKYSRWLSGNLIEWVATGTGTSAFYIFGDNNGYGRVRISSSENYLTLRGGHSRSGGGSVAIIPFTADAVVCSIYGVTSQSANLLEFRNPTFSTVYSTVSENGYYTTRKTSAPADAELAAGECSWWFDSTNGAAKFMVKAKSADGTVVSGELALA